MHTFRNAGLITLFAALLFSQASSQTQDQAKGKGGGNSLIQSLPDLQNSLKGKLERITIHAKSLEGNLEGDSPDRDVFVYLPPI